MESDRRNAAIRQLTDLLRQTGNQITSNKSQLTLPGAYLNIVTKRFARLDANARSTVDDSLQNDLVYLREFFKLTPALKVEGVSKDGSSDVNISGFSSLESLSVRKIPVEQIKGLASLKDTLCRLSCQRSYTLVRLKDLLDDDDEARRTPWMKLTDLDVSYNAIEELDNSLKLCPSLQTLDMSHNRISIDCGGLQNLPELSFLNLSFNRFEVLPEFSRRACLRLTKLVLRNNNLGSINGIEFLTHLEELDLSYNCLISHGLLSPLSQLNQLTKLHLQHNPFAHHPNHRCLTAMKLSPHVNPAAISLDGKQLTEAERRYLPKPDFYGINSPSHDPIYLAAAMRPPTPLRATSPVRRVVSRSRSRQVDIRDGDDETDQEREEKKEKQAARKKFLSQEDSFGSAKQREVESLRRDLGTKWLESQQKSHTEKEIAATVVVKQKETTETKETETKKTEKPKQQKKTTKEKEKTNVITQQTDTDTKEEREEDHHGVANETFLVSVNESDDETDGERKVTSRFLTITDRFIIEEEDTSAKVVGKLDYRSCLERVVMKTESGVEVEALTEDVEKNHKPVLYLDFSHARLDRQKRIYAMKSWESGFAFRDLLQESINSRTAIRSIQPKYECLKCSAVFEQRLSHDGRFSPPTCCPNCHNEDCVVQIQSENPSSSSFFPYAVERNASTPPFPLLVTKPNADVASVDDVDTSLSGQASPACFTPPLDSAGVRMSVFARAQTSRRNLVSQFDKSHALGGSPNFATEKKKVAEALDESVSDDWDENKEIPHQLLLHYELEVFHEGNFVNHFKCGLSGGPSFGVDRPGLVVLSTVSCYFCLCKGKMRMDSFDWLVCEQSCRIDSLEKVTVGLGHQYLFLDFLTLSCTVIFRNSTRCRTFLDQLEALVSKKHKVASVCPRTAFNLRTQVFNFNSKESLACLASDIEDVILSTTDLVQDRRRLMSSYSRTFLASQFVTWLCNNNISLNRDEARELGQKLLNLGVLKHAWSQTVFEDNSSLLSFVRSPRTDDPHHDDYEHFILCHKSTSPEGASETAAFIITKDSVYVAKMNLDPPKGLTQRQFTSVQTKKIDSIIKMTAYASKPKAIYLEFFEEDIYEGDSSWYLSFETVRLCQDVQTSLQQFWRDAFGGVDMNFSVAV